MPVLAVHHGGRTVADMERSLHFYRDLLGLEIVDDDTQGGPEVESLVGVEGARIRIVFLSPDGNLPFVELIEYVEAPGRRPDGNESAADVGSTHVCLLVDDIHKEQERLSAAGVKFNGPPVLDDAHFKGEWCTYCYDPDGFPVELWSK
jgi:catechol 2,3-dioxygenase-like lactoylglutathione lyase family enzyme